MERVTMTVVTKLQTVQNCTILQRCTKTDVQSAMTVLQNYNHRVAMTVVTKLQWQSYCTKTVVLYVELWIDLQWQL